MRIALNDHWTLTGAGFRVEDCTLPISIARALENAGIVHAEAAGLDGLGSEWIYRRAWTLHTRVDVQQCTHERLILSLPELYGRGWIALGGVRAAEFDGVRSPASVEIEATACLLQGEADVAIHFEPQTTAPFGLSAGAQLRGVNMLRLRRFCVLAGDASLRAFAQVEAYVPGTYRFRYAFEQDGNALGSIEFEHALVPGCVELEHLLEATDGFAQAQRWRVRRENAPLHVRLLITRRGELCDAALVLTGLRRIERTHPAPGLCACVSGLDGQPTAMRGACCDPQPMDDGRAVAAQAQAAGMNALYVTSRASDAFYRACDVLGLMVFQELPLEAAAAEDALRALGAHPCVVQWGCAAVAGAQGRMTDTSHPLIAAIPELLARYGDERPFAGAPSQHMADALHSLGPDELLGPERTPRFYQEDTAPYRTLRIPALAHAADFARAADGQTAWPPETNRPLWTYRGGLQPAADRMLLRDFLGEDVWENGELIGRLTRFWQAESVRYALEQARYRRAFGLFAQRLGAHRLLLSDDVLIEQSGRARPAYFAFAHAMKPVHVCARIDRTGYWTDTRFEAFVRVICDADVPEPAQIVAALYRPDGTSIVQETFACELHTGEYGCVRAQLPDEPGALVLRLTLRTADRVLDETDQVICVGLYGPLWPLVHLSAAALRVRAGSVENTGVFTAVGVSGPELGWRCLLPGERAAFGGTQEMLEGMNLIIS